MGCWLAASRRCVEILWTVLIVRRAGGRPPPTHATGSGASIGACELERWPQSVSRKHPDVRPRAF
ncbi:hypothetical protein NS365_13415 [Aureimonas ureilytica]|uniref:Uncharacterized protein n=1 Tax=Aureimonas ureilytica TaxID=401562 RepID=A0A175RNX3_9HYPH|nr:hypothetical protein NS365_13415 [Aureimonas ureilytica]